MTGTFRSSTGQELFGSRVLRGTGSVSFVSRPAVNYSAWPSAVVVDRQARTSSNFGSDHFFCSRSRQNIR
jgi:hypothetical protein